MGAACCRCVQPASVQPRKTYNTLVGQLFGGEPIKTDDAIDSTMRRKIQKLQEYLQANPAKVPKASRRLMRKIQGTVRKPGDNLGHVKVAVHTYAYLLAMTADDGSSYGPTFFLKELLTGPEAVVPLLLKDMHIEMRTLGAELLAVFTSVQSPEDSKLDAIQAHVSQVCRVARMALQSDRKEQKLQETTKRRRAGDKLAVPDPIYLIGRKDPAHVAALEVACLRCLKEVVTLCRKNKVVPAQLSDIQAVMLDNLRASRGGTGAFGAHEDTAGAAAADLQESLGADGTPGSPSAPAAAAAVCGQSVVDMAFYKEMGVQQHVPEGCNPRVLATQLLQQMAGFVQDIAMVDSILDSFYRYMDNKHRWQQQQVVKNFLEALGSSGGQHHYPIYASLLRHAASRDLAVADCSAVLRVAREQGVGLDEAYSLSALQLALAELPKAWAEQARRDPKFLLHWKPLLDLFRAGTAAIKDLAHLPADAGPAAVPRAGSSSQAGTPTAAGTPRTGSQAGAADTAGGASGEPALQQQLAGLKLTMLETVQALAARVQTAAELCEVITGVLTAVAADLNYSGHSHARTPSSAAGAVAAAMNGPAGDAASSPFQPMAATAASFSPPAGTRERQLAAGDPAKLARAGVALDLAAAAAEARMQDQQPFRTPLSSFTTSASSSVTGWHGALRLPNGVLPVQLLSAALPLMQHGPPVVRHAVQRILLALLPGAPQGVHSPNHAKQLAEAALLEARQAEGSAAAAAAAVAPGDEALHDDSDVSASVAGADALLRCCLKGQQPSPSAVLTLSRALLQHRAQWVQHGYRGGSGGSHVRAHAVLLFFNSQLAVLAERTRSRNLLTHQLPLDAQSHPFLQLTAGGLVLTAGGAAASAARSDAVLQELERQHPPTQQHVEGLRSALSQVPVLVAAHGDQLPGLLDAQRGMRVSTASSDADRLETPQLAKVNTVLTKQSSTLSRDLMPVGDLLKRESISRGQHVPSLAAVVDEQHSAAAAGASASRSAGNAAAVLQDTAAGEAPAVNSESVRVKLPHASPSSREHATLSGSVAAVLRQPGVRVAGAPAVRDIKISKLAGELDSQL